MTSSRSYGRHETGLSTSDRFGRMTSGSSSASRGAPLKIEEDVSIVIERRIQGTPSRGPLVRRFDPDVDPVRVTRRPDEGQGPIFYREEILKFRHDAKDNDENRDQLQHGRGPEKRSIRVTTRRSRSRSRSRSWSRSRPRLRLDRSRSLSRSPVLLRFERRPPLRIHDRVGVRRRQSSLSPAMPHVQQRQQQEQIRQHRDQPQRRVPIAERLGRRPQERIQQSADHQLVEMLDARAPINPLDTPKAPSYFLHDDRGAASGSATGDRFDRRRVGAGGFFRRGSGGGRVRGFGRGGGGSGGQRRRFNNGGSSIEGKWRHDKFAEVEDDDVDDKGLAMGDE